VELTPWSGPMAYDPRASQCKSQVRGIVVSCLSLAGCFWFCQTRVRTKLRTTAELQQLGTPLTGATGARASFSAGSFICERQVYAHVHNAHSA